jgi:porphyrinogen peroxidase
MPQPESQSGILVDPPPLARSLTYRLHGAADAAATLRAFAANIPADLRRTPRSPERCARPRPGAAAAAAAIVHGSGALDGSSYVAVQRWIHDLQRFAAFSPDQADAVIGRRLVTNEEIADVPPSAQTFVVRRSMPWSDGEDHGLEFIAFGDTLDKFERILRRMLGLDDGIVDALFTFSRPVRGGYYWCPPLRSGQLDLSALGIEG